ncbi:MAG: ABC transporter ATP-binding protein [Chloroflexi bacterium]|nr:MAG: ABC transporter ATP-binding protein [Chloroflexota bacterium]
MSDFILQAVAVSKTYYSAAGELEAVADINLTVCPGEFLCIVGPSGCGKTTLLQLLAGLLPPTRGEVRLAGVPLTEPHPDIAVVFQKPHLMPWRTVRQNVLLPLQVAGLPTDEADRRAAEALSLVRLADFADVYPKSLSGGMEQRVAVARALAQHPRLLLLDEPFGALDALTRERLNRRLLHIWQTRRLTAVMVTHNIREAVYLADRVLVLSPRPATVSAEFSIDLPRPRPDGIEYSEAFGRLAYEIRQAIRE